MLNLNRLFSFFESLTCSIWFSCSKMRLWDELFVLAVIVFASSGIAVASSPSAADISDEDITYLAPLLDGCHVGDRHCEMIDGKYMVTLREGYTPSAHLAYIAERINIDPVIDWKIKWIGDENYTINNVSAESVHLLRQDPGVDEIGEQSWIFLIEVDVCRNPSLSAEEKIICYEEEDLPECERPSLSKEDRQICYGWNKQLYCEYSLLSEDDKQSCLESCFITPCENPKLSEEQQRYCRDGSLFATCNNPLLTLLEGGRRTCAREIGVERLEASSVSI
jgi:hypothetical protein